MVSAQTFNDSTISLPTFQSIEAALQGCHVSILDISNMFFAFEYSEKSMHYVNFYYIEKFLTHWRLAQGWYASPNIAQQAMDRTFADHVLQEFIKKENLNYDDQFPFSKYDDFTKVFVEDVSIFSKQSLKKETHFLCLKAVFIALKQSGWLISVEKCSIFSKHFIFLGCTYFFSISYNYVDLDTQGGRSLDP